MGRSRGRRKKDKQYQYLRIVDGMEDCPSRWDAVGFKQYLKHVEPQCYEELFEKVKNGGTHRIGTVAFRRIAQSVKQRLAEIATTIVHSDDYGSCFWNERTATVHWHWIHGDFNCECATGLTLHEEIARRFKIVPEVRHITIGIENNPDPKSEWEKINF